MSMLVSFVLSFFPRDVLDEILNLIGSVSEGFPSYFYNNFRKAELNLKISGLPFLSQKSAFKIDSNIILKAVDFLISDQKEMCKR